MPPSWRPDLTGKAELAEEVARLVGYHRIPSVLPVAPPGRGLTRSQRLRRQTADVLAAAGSTEVLSFPFATADENAFFGSVDGAPVASVRIANALDQSAPFLRRSLLPGLVGAARRNRSRGLNDLDLFEIGLVFLPETDRTYGSGELPVGDRRPSDDELARLQEGIPPQPRHLAVLLVGDVVAKQPGQPAVAAGVAHALDAVREVALAIGADLEIVQGSHQALHPGRTAELRVAGRIVGYAGELLPAFAEEADLPRVVAVAELDLDAVIDATAPRWRRARSAPSRRRHRTSRSWSAPRCRRARSRVRCARARGSSSSTSRSSTTTVAQACPVGAKSLTFALRFRAPDRTLTAAEASDAKLAGAALAAKRTGAAIRE